MDCEWNIKILKVMDKLRVIKIFKAYRIGLSYENV